MATLPSSHAAPIIERAPLPIVEVRGSAHTVTHVNAAFCKLLGRTRAELIGQRFSDIAPGGDACVPLLDQIYETGQAITHALEERDTSETAWVYAMWPALDPEQRPEGVIIGMTKVSSFRQNITDMNEALLIAGLREQESKEAAEVMNAQLHVANAQLASTDRHKDEFLAMLAHELRNPLAPIKNAAHILQLANSQDPTIIRAQAIIERQVDHLTKLVDELLDQSRIQQGKIRIARVHLDVAKLVARALEACEELITTQRHKVTLQVPDGAAPVIDADPTRIEQVLVNLITNAAKYTPPGGEIRISVAREGRMAVVRIRDTGIGIAPDDLRRVFELFTQVEQSLARSQGGLGLGLRLVKELVDLHGGEVEARSEGLDKGSEFIVKLPAVDAPKLATGPAHAGPVVATPRHILVVEDSPDNRETMEMLLASQGHTVESAEDGEQAVEKALQGNFDVAFVDIGLPKLNGYEVAEAIRQAPRGQHIVLIALSGYGRPEDKLKAVESGFDAHLTKPVKLADFKEVLAGLEKLRTSVKEAPRS